MKHYRFFFQDNGVPRKMSIHAENEQAAQAQFWANFSPVELLKIVLGDIVNFDP